MVRNFQNRCPKIWRSLDQDYSCTESELLQTRNIVYDSLLATVLYLLTYFIAKILVLCHLDFLTNIKNINSLVTFIILAIIHIRAIVILAFILHYKLEKEINISNCQT